MVTFASGSAVENFLALKPSLGKDVRIASLGPVTSTALREAGLRVDVQSPRRRSGPVRRRHWKILFGREQRLTKLPLIREKSAGVA